MSEIHAFRACIYASRSEKVDRAMRNIAKYRFSLQNGMQMYKQISKKLFAANAKTFKKSWSESETEIC